MIKASPDGLAPLDRGSYIIIFHLKTNKKLRIGKLGTFVFQRGYFAYVGSAFGPGGLASRIRHHLARSGRAHWHVDYLSKSAVPEEVWVGENKDRREHIWASILNRWDAAGTPAPGFGCSDCKCRTHLFSFRQRPSFPAFNARVRQTLPKDPGIRRIAFRP